jgi:hypothetical protein
MRASDEGCSFSCGAFFVSLTDSGAVSCTIFFSSMTRVFTTSVFGHISSGCMETGISLISVIGVLSGVSFSSS